MQQLLKNKTPSYRDPSLQEEIYDNIPIADSNGVMHIYRIKQNNFDKSYSFIDQSGRHFKIKNMTENAFDIPELNLHIEYLPKTNSIVYDYIAEQKRAFQPLDYNIIELRPHLRIVHYHPNLQIKEVNHVDEHRHEFFDFNGNKTIIQDVENKKITFINPKNGENFSIILDDTSISGCRLENPTQKEVAKKIINSLLEQKLEEYGGVHNGGLGLLSNAYLYLNAIDPANVYLFFNEYGDSLQDIDTLRAKVFAHDTTNSEYKLVKIGSSALQHAALALVTRDPQKRSFIFDTANPNKGLSIATGFGELGEACISPLPQSIQNNHICELISAVVALTCERKSYLKIYRELGLTQHSIIDTLTPQIMEKMSKLFGEIPAIKSHSLTLEEQSDGLLATIAKKQKQRIDDKNIKDIYAPELPIYRRNIKTGELEYSPIYREFQTPEDVVIRKRRTSTRLFYRSAEDLYLEHLRRLEANIKRLDAIGIDIPPALQEQLDNRRKAYIIQPKSHHLQIIHKKPSSFDLFR